MKWLEVTPLSIFVLYIRYIDMNAPQDWNIPFLISGAAALVAVVLYLAQKMHFNHLFLGINLYFISGSIAIITQQFWLNKMYGELHASGMLAWIVMVGFMSSLFSPQGFIGVYSTSKSAIKGASLLLLFSSICAFGLSFAFRGNRLFSEVVPFILIFFTQHLLKNKIADVKNTNNL